MFKPMYQKEKDKMLKTLLEEAVKRGFLEGNVVSFEDGGKGYEKGSNAITTYKCAESGKDCTFYFYPTEFIYNSNHRGALTDGKGGYIYYNGKWAENTTTSWLREQRLKKLL